VPSFSLQPLASGFVRPLVVAIAFLPILIMSLCAIPVWAVAVCRPATHGELAMCLLRGLHNWSRDVIRAVYGGQGR
jgi:hypothetical protein